MQNRHKLFMIYILTIFSTSSLMAETTGDQGSDFGLSLKIMVALSFLIFALLVWIIVVFIERDSSGEISSSEGKSTPAWLRPAILGAVVASIVVTLAITFIPWGSITSGSEEVAEAETAKEEYDPNNPLSSKGVGPVSSITLGAIDNNLAKQGGELFIAKCSACHKMEKRFVGPALHGVTERRSPEWIMNMILNPEQMIKEDPIAKNLFMEYLAPMANQSLKEEEARLILEYFRTVPSITE